MSYSIKRYNDGVVVESNGDEIYRSPGGDYRREEIQNAILTDANFGSPQKEALSALLGLLDVDYVNEPMPNQS